MNMYNNSNQQAPAYQYGYNDYQYPRYATHSQVAQQAAMVPPQPSYQIPQPQAYLKGRPVVSIDEARASQIDLDGSLYIFPDLGNKKIYTKKINLDGTAAFNVFTLTETPVEEPNTAPFVTRDELNAILAEFKNSLEKPDAAKGKGAAQFNL